MLFNGLLPGVQLFGFAILNFCVLIYIYAFFQAQLHSIYLTPHVHASLYIIQ